MEPNARAVEILLSNVSKDEQFAATNKSGANGRKDKTHSNVGWRDNRDRDLS